MREPGPGETSFGSYFGDVAVPVAPAVPAVVAGRYAIAARIGSGAFGVVYRAEDRLSRRAVAVKLLNPGTDAARVRREVVALRGLRLPGVVALLDEGCDRDQPFLVMDLVEGAPFPGRDLPVAWHALRPLARGLLTVVGRVHAAGVMHLDLKPANVLVTAAGEVVMLDLGLAGGPALGGAAGQGALIGTERYMAPEQRRGAGMPQSDLFAAGVMLWEALTGTLPPTERSIGSASLRAGDAPPAVVSAICQLLARNPDARPATAWEALDRLDDAPPRPWTPPLPPGDGPVSADALRACFHGPEQLLHVPGDAAARLHARTGGVRERVTAELQRWIRLGLAVPEGARLRVDRVALEQPDIEEYMGQPGAGVASRPADRADPAEAELARMIATGESAAVPGAALSVARAHFAHGRLDRARLALARALVLIRREEAPPAHEAALLSLWACIGLEERSPHALEVALYELGRAVRRTPGLEATEALLRSALHAERGDAERGRALLAGLAPFEDAAVELWRFAVRQRLAESEGEQVSVLDEARAWAATRDDRDAEARVLDWTARLRYGQGRFEEAGTLQERAVARARTPTLRLGSRLNAVSAWMEAGRYEEAHNGAMAALVEARDRRYPVYEGRAVWLLRAVAYRADRLREPDLELVNASSYLHVPYLEALIALTEAAVAWRAGDHGCGGALAIRAAERFEAAHMSAGCMVARALALVCAPQPVSREEIDALAGEVLAQRLPDFDWQILGVLATLPAGAAWRDRAVRLASAAPRPSKRRELVAPCEVLAAERV